jgi:hypothetical protein
MVLPVRILSDFGPKCEFFPHPFQTPNQHPNNLVQGIICICHHGSVSTEAHSSKVQVCGRATMNSLWLSWARACPVTACANGVQATRHGTFFSLMVLSYHRRTICSLSNPLNNNWWGICSRFRKWVVLKKISSLADRDYIVGRIFFLFLFRATLMN